MSLDSNRLAARPKRPRQRYLPISLPPAVVYTFLFATHPQGVAAGSVDESLLTEIIRWDVRNWSEPILYWNQRVDWSGVQQCLEIGGREGGLSLWMAKKGKHVVCSDVIDVQQAAKEHHQRYGVDSLIRYEYVDATNIPYENHFDLVAFKSTLGAIVDKEAQRTAIHQIHKALKPGGLFLFAENLVASPLHMLARRRFAAWSSAWRYVTVSEMREFMAPFASVETRTTGVLGTFGRNEWQRRLLGGVDQALLKRVTPARWQYIVYGIAKKAPA